MSYQYFPGCSLKSTGRAYEESLLEVFRALDVPLTELDDWNCCGATSYMSINEMKAFALASRNLALAEAQAKNAKNELIAPCSACYLVLMKTQKYLEQHPAEKKKIQHGLNEIGLSYKGDVHVRHPLDVFVNDVGLEKISKTVKVPLKELKVASYYGCQIVRPYPEFDDARQPDTMDRLVTALGATAVDWPLKTRCCGGSLIGTIPDVGLRLSYVLLKEAQRRGANMLITVCPLCQFNLECYQDMMNKRFNDNLHIPIVYFTQLMGMAFGIPGKKLGLNRLFIQPEVKKGEAAYA